MRGVCFSPLIAYYIMPFRAHTRIVEIYMSTFLVSVSKTAMMWDVMPISFRRMIDTSPGEDLQYIIFMLPTCVSSISTFYTQYIKEICWYVTASVFSVCRNVVCTDHFYVGDCGKSRDSSI